MYSESILLFFAFKPFPPISNEAHKQTTLLEIVLFLRSLIPSKVQLFHQLLTQLEAVDNGEKKVLNWCKEAESLMASVSYTGEPSFCSGL